MPQNALEIRQLLAGRDFARSHPVAHQLVNFSYLIASRRSRECVLVDPAWDVTGLMGLAEAEGYNVVGALATHYHPDHVGGDLFGLQVEGVKEFLGRAKAKVFVNATEAEGLKGITGAAESDLTRTENGQILDLDGASIEFLHTPGHTPGSQCFYVNETYLVSGDTLFVGGCGRVDLPGGDAAELYRSLNERLASLPGDTILYPGHDYGHVPFRSLAEERKQNMALLAPSLEVWRRMMGGA